MKINQIIENLSTEVIIFITILFVITSVSAVAYRMLSNHLKKAIKSNAELYKENKMLEENIQNKKELLKIGDEIIAEKNKEIECLKKYKPNRGANGKFLKKNINQ
jgi:cell division protein FtsB